MFHCTHQEKLPVPTQRNIKVAGCSLRSKYTRLVSIHKLQSELKQSSSLYRAHSFGGRDREKLCFLYKTSDYYFIWSFVFQDLGLESSVRRVQINLISQKYGSQSWESEQKMEHKQKYTMEWALGGSQGNKKSNQYT